jgi:hypothetical protein
MENEMNVNKTKKRTISMIISGLATVLVLSGGYIGYKQYGYKQDTTKIRNANAKLKKDMKSIEDFHKINDLPDTVDADKKRESATELFNSQISKNIINLKYAELMNNSYLALFNSETVYNKYIQNYEPKTSNQEIKDLIDDLKLEQKRRLEDASELKDQSTEMLKYMKANDTFQWNQGMSYINDEDKKYSDQEDKYFDVKHKLEKVYNHLKNNYDQNKRKLKETESKLIFK